jgi:hypothetical protein
MRKIVLWYGRHERLLNLAAAILILTFTGPFGTYMDFEFWPRLLFWSVAMAGAGVFIHGSNLALLALGIDTRRGRTLAVFVGTLIGSFPATAFVLWVLDIVGGSSFVPSDYPRIWSNVIVICFLVVPFQFRQEIFHQDTEEEPTAEPDEVPMPPALAPIHERLPSHLKGAEILSFSMQDHYVDITTARGRHMMLMRFSDALDMMGDLPGVRTHRSHWVSDKALLRIGKAGRKHSVTLTDGRKIPVSSTYLAEVKRRLNQKARP